MRILFLMLLPLLLITLVSPVKALDEDLLLILSFDVEGREGTDETGRTKGATIIGGVKLVDGKFGKALELDGKSGYLEVEETAELTFNEESSFTVEFWTKTTHKPMFLQPLGLTGTYGATLPPRLWNIWLRENAAFFFALKEPWSAMASQITEVNNGEWHHVAAVRDRKDKVMRLYLDGKLLVDDRDDSVNIDSGQGKFWIGLHRDRFWPVAFDEFRIWGRALSDTEIAEAMVSAIMAADPLGKLATAWGSIK